MHHSVPIVPSGPPQNFQGSATSSRSVFLTWDSPRFEDQNGVITGYTINITFLETMESFELLSTSNNLTADSLTPFSMYIFKIAGQTVIGVGNFSTAITVMTPEAGKECTDGHIHFLLDYIVLRINVIVVFFAVPSEPQNSNVLSIHSLPTELLITWDPPAEPNGILVSYTVYCALMHSNQTRSLPDIGTADYKRVPGNETETVFANLTPFSLYGCVVTANTSVGEGNSSFIKFNITDESGRCYAAA